MKKPPGKKRKRKTDALKGKSCSLLNNFSPSRTACATPKKKTLFGPRRPCLSLKICRSNKVIKATDKTKKTKTKRTEKKKKKNKTKFFKFTI
jgi:hypothetical protein